MPVTTTITNFDAISGFVYRACWMVEYLRSTGAITAGQAAAVLASWNGQIRATAGPVQVTLPGAADQTKAALATWWNSGGTQLKSRCTIFSQTLLAQFPEEDVTSHPCSNWGVLINSLASTF